jgi:hypothetical protein
MTFSRIKDCAPGNIYEDCPCDPEQASSDGTNNTSGWKTSLGTYSNRC